MNPGPVEQSIRQSIEKNGFPAKTVRLPFKPVYQSCKQHRTSLSAVLKNLEAENIYGRIQGDHIAFRTRERLEEHVRREADTGPSAETGGWFDAAQDSLKNLTPEQLDQLKSQVNNMSDEEKQNLMQLFSEQFKPKPL